MEFLHWAKQDSHSPFGVNILPSMANEDELKDILSLNAGWNYKPQ